MSKNKSQQSVSVRQSGRQADIVSGLRNPAFQYDLAASTARSLGLPAKGAYSKDRRGNWSKI